MSKYDDSNLASKEMRKLAKARKKRLDLPPASELAAMMDAGETTAQLGGRFGCSASVIAQRVRDSGYGGPSDKPKRVEQLPTYQTAWMDQALCAQTDPGLFFPSAGDTGEAARRICERCPVRQRCLESALREEQGLPHTHRHGIRGGIGARARYRMAVEAEGEVA